LADRQRGKSLMHLLLAQKGTISDSDEAFDLGQSPADIVFLSAADTEISSVAAAVGGSSVGWRLVNLASLKHPMSIDMWIDRTARHARLVVLRPLGGTSYFSYLIEALLAASKAHGFALAVLPGDDRPDAGLDVWSTVGKDDCAALWSYLVEGGIGNIGLFATYAEALVAGTDRPPAAEALAKAGIWWPGRGVIDVEAWEGLQSPVVVNSARPAPLAVITFYRALVQSGQTEPVQALLEALGARGLRVLPIFVASLKEPTSARTIRTLFAALSPDVVLNSTSFAVVSPGADNPGTVLDQTGAQVLQVIFSAASRDGWASSTMGLPARDLAMNVALPEVDGRILTRAVSFKHAARYDERTEVNIVAPVPEPDRIAFVAEQAARWARLRHLDNGDKRVALIMANYPNRDGRLGNGVGLDTPAGSMEVLKAMREAGYPVADLPEDGDRLIRHLMEGPTNAATDGRVIRETLSLSHYNAFFATLPVQIQDEVNARWGDPESDAYFREGSFALPLARFGQVLTGIQPARGYNLDPKETYHSPDLVPPHGYFAFYAFIRESFGADAVIHMGKHGNMEWLPGKAMALSATCYPEAVFGPLPHLYPFIVNDPGEGTQAKRRSSAVIIDHLTPPLTRAESYGYLKDLEALVDEYFQAQGTDSRRLRLLKQQILDLAADTGLRHDAGIDGLDEDAALQKLDAWLCDLKEMQIRDGLHVFGVAPVGRLLTDLTVALARVPRGSGEGAGQSLQRAIAQDILQSAAPAFDPLDCDMAEPWAGARPPVLAELSDDVWRTNGDTVERIELLAARLVAGECACPEDWIQTRMVMDEIETRLKPSLEACGRAEIESLMKGLSGRFVAPGPSGAPTRGRPDVLPTGRNFYSVDTRSVPTPTAWELGRKSAEMLVTRYVQDHGDWPDSIGITCWGTSNMRTGGDDIAQALALIGAKPVWDMGSARVTGYEITPMAMLGRPRVDVTLRISGFFRDAFPEQIALFDRAVRAIGALAEDEADNPIAARMRAEADVDVRQAGLRVFGSKPGAYGAGLQALMDEDIWTDKADLADSFLNWGGYAYGGGEEGEMAREAFEARLATLQAVVQNQDNREHDLLDSDDYYQFEGGMAAAVAHLSGKQPAIYHNDHSRPEKPVIRSLEEEISRVMRGRVVNPKWIAGVMRHGYKGAAEIAATVDFMFAYAATTGAVKDHHFEAAYQAFLMDERVLDFLADKNPAALRELATKFLQSIDRTLWTPKSNSARYRLEEMAGMVAAKP
jgi:cobaltochelatase CobN